MNRSTLSSIHDEKNSNSIISKKKDGDWYIYPWFLAHENFNNTAHKNVQKSSKMFKLNIHSVVSTGTNFVKIPNILCQEENEVMVSL